jgi:hypothetical protein
LFCVDERALASIERGSDDLQKKKVDKFEEREGALRERFQQAMN